MFITLSLLNPGNNDLLAIAEKFGILLADNDVVFTQFLKFFYEENEEYGLF